MDVSRLKELGWKLPETFVVKAADGVTDIYGNMWKPFDFDSTKKYPIIANVYPGPQTEGGELHVLADAVPQQLAQLGFIVIQIGNRGGSPQRSKAYQGFGYFNLRDYALADKKAGIEQLAARHKWIDIDRVGIYGHSGGGFLTAAAMLLPPYNEFFKVGVSESGNHDNNIYNQNWSEQYHGLKIDREGAAADAACVKRAGAVAATRTATAVRAGTPTASRPRGRGSSSTVRSPTTIRPTRSRSTCRRRSSWRRTSRAICCSRRATWTTTSTRRTRFVWCKALIKANKRFDFMMLPGKPHGYGDMTPYTNHLMFEYFAEHLLGDYYRKDAAYEIRSRSSSSRA